MEDSANVAAIGYDHVDEVLEIIFKASPDTIYRYRDFPSKAFLLFINTPSMGEAFAAAKPLLGDFEKVPKYG